MSVRTLLKGLPISGNSWSAIARLFVAGVLITHVYFLWMVSSRIPRADPDFTVFYTAGKMLRSGLGPELYDLRAQFQVQQRFATDSDIRRGPLPYIHPPFEALLFVPLTVFGYRSAFLLWSLANVVMLTTVCWLLRQMITPFRRLRIWEFVLLCLAFFPVLANFHQGQDAILLLLIVTLAVRSADQDAPFAAGWWLGLGSFKYHLVLPLFFILWMWRGRRFLSGFALSCSAAVLISLAIVGWNGALKYPSLAWKVVSEPSLGGIPLRRVPNLAGLIGGWPLSAKWDWGLPVVILAASAALIYAVVRFQSYCADRKSFRLCVASALITAVLVAYSTNTYDLCLLIPALAIIAEHLIETSTKTVTANWGFLVPMFFLCVSPVWFFLWMRWERINIMAVFLLWMVLATRNDLLRLREPKDARPESVLV